MAFQMIPVKNQKFEIGRTINLSKCDCKECTYMNCPKHNYAVRMAKKYMSETLFSTTLMMILIVSLLLVSANTGRMAVVVSTEKQDVLGFMLK